MCTLQTYISNLAFKLHIHPIMYAIGSLSPQDLDKYGNQRMTRRPLKLVIYSCSLSSAAANRALFAAASGEKYNSTITAQYNCSNARAAVGVSVGASRNCCKVKGSWRSLPLAVFKSVQTAQLFEWTPETRVGQLQLNSIIWKPYKVLARKSC